MDLTIERIDRTTVKVPFRDVPDRNMRRQLPHWQYLDVFEVELADGTIGHGEDMIYYGWGTVTDDILDRARGGNAAALLWDDSLGSLQIALFDAVGRALDVSVHELLGDRRRDAVPLGWWCIDMPADDWIAECELAIERGYTAAKLKGRPWQDVRANVAELCASLPEWFSVGIDFNSMLLDADRALPILEELAEHPQVTVFESPIPQGDVAGNRRLARALDETIAQHSANPDLLTQLQTGIAEGFVLGTGGPTALTEEAGLAAGAGMPFWIQNLGMLTAAFWIHAGATMAQNVMPNVLCNHLFAASLLDEPLAVEDGAVPVPEGPGLGVKPDPDVLARYAVDRPTDRPDPDRLVVAEWPDHDPVVVARGAQLDAMAKSGELPYFERGVQTRLLPDDGSDAWTDLHARAAREPVVGPQPEVGIDG